MSCLVNKMSEKGERCRLGKQLVLSQAGTPVFFPAEYCELDKKWTMIITINHNQNSNPSTIRGTFWNRYNPWRPLLANLQEGSQHPGAGR